MPDFNIAESVVQPNVNLLGGMKSLADLQMAEAHASLFGAQARQVNARQNALQAYAIARSKGDPNAMDIIAAVDPSLAKEMQSYDQTGKEIKATQNRGAALIKENPKMSESDKAVANFPATQKTVADTDQTRTMTAEKQLETHIKNAGAMSNQALKLVDQVEKGEITKEQFRFEWNKTLKQAASFDLINGLQYNNYFDATPAQARKFAEQAQQMSITAQEAITNSGQPAGNKLRAEMEPTTELERRKAIIGVQKDLASPRTVSSEGGMLTPNKGISGPGGFLDPRSITPGGPTPLSPATLGYGSTFSPAAAASPAASTAEAPAVVPATAPAAASKWGQMPVIPPLEGPPGEGYIKQPMPKHVTDALNKTNGDTQKNILDVGTGAQSNYDALSRMETKLQEGLKTNKLMPVKTELAAGIYALTGDQKIAKDITGVDLPSAETFQKEATRMGLTFARQTEGAREAVQAIKIALGANPQLSTSTEGNLKIIGVLKEVARWQADRAQAANEYGITQATKGANGLHYTGFDQWWNKNHPMTEYTSRAVPLALPSSAHSSPDDLQPNTTYNTPRGPAKFTGKTSPEGKPVFVGAGG